MSPETTKVDQVAQGTLQSSRRRRRRGRRRKRTTPVTQSPLTPKKSGISAKAEAQLTALCGERSSYPDSAATEIWVRAMTIFQELLNDRRLRVKMTRAKAEVPKEHQAGTQLVSKRRQHNRVKTPTYNPFWAVVNSASLTLHDWMGRALFFGPHSTFHSLSQSPEDRKTFREARNTTTTLQFLKTAQESWNNPALDRIPYQKRQELQQLLTRLESLIQEQGGTPLEQSGTAQLTALERRKHVLQLLQCAELQTQAILRSSNVKSPAWSCRGLNDKIERVCTEYHAQLRICQGLLTKLPSSDQLPFEQLDAFIEAMQALLKGYRASLLPLRSLLKGAGANQLRGDEQYQTIAKNQLVGLGTYLSFGSMISSQIAFHYNFILAEALVSSDVISKQSIEEHTGRFLDCFQELETVYQESIQSHLSAENPRIHQPQLQENWQTAATQLSQLKSGGWRKGSHESAFAWLLSHVLLPYEHLESEKQTKAIGEINRLNEENIGATEKIELFTKYAGELGLPEEGAEQLKLFAESMKSFLSLGTSEDQLDPTPSEQEDAFDHYDFLATSLYSTVAGMVTPVVLKREAVKSEQAVQPPTVDQQPSKVRGRTHRTRIARGKKSKGRRGQRSRHKGKQKQRVRPVKQDPDPVEEIIPSEPLPSEVAIPVRPVEVKIQPTALLETTLSRIADLQATNVLGDVNRAARGRVRRIARTRLKLNGRSLLMRLQRLERNQRPLNLDEGVALLDRSRRLLESALEICLARYPIVSSTGGHVLFRSKESARIGIADFGHNLSVPAELLLAADQQVPSDLRELLLDHRRVIYRLAQANRLIHYRGRAEALGLHKHPWNRELFSLLQRLDRAQITHRELLKEIVQSYVIPAINCAHGLVKERAIDGVKQSVKLSASATHWLERQEQLLEAMESAHSLPKGLGRRHQAWVQEFSSDSTPVKVEDLETVTKPEEAMRAVRRSRQMARFLMHRPAYGPVTVQTERRTALRDRVNQDLVRHLRRLESCLNRRAQGQSDPNDCWQSLITAIRALREAHVAALLNLPLEDRGVHVVKLAGGDGNRSLEYATDIVLLNRYLRRCSSEGPKLPELSQVPDLTSARWLRRGYRFLNNPAYQLLKAKQQPPSDPELRKLAGHLRQLCRLNKQLLKIADVPADWNLATGDSHLNPHDVKEAARTEIETLEQHFLYPVLTALQRVLYHGFPKPESRNPFAL